MKKIICLSSLLALGPVAASHADLLFADNFSYPAGNLVGQASWAQTSTSAVTPIQVTAGGTAAIGTSGQDVYVPLGSVYNLTDNSSFYVGLTINVASAQATGDYFFHTTPTVGNSSTFVDRVFAKSSGAGFVIGYESNSGTGAVVSYGTTVLTLGTSYRVVLAYNDVAGALNDTASIYVNPADTSVEGNNTAYLGNVAWSTTTPENDAVAALNFRQGSATAAPALTVDDLDAGTSFSDIAAVPTVTPEPTTYALLGLGAAIFCGFRRRK